MRYVFLALVICLGAVPRESLAAVATIHKGSHVSLEYVLTVDGKEIDSSKGRAPLEYTQGDGKLIPGLVRQLEGLKAGDEKTIVVAPKEAYGEIDPTATREVPLSALPKQVKPAVGMMLQATDNNGRTVLMRIAQINKDVALMDLNHPLAGKTLSFEVKILSIQ